MSRREVTDHAAHSDGVGVNMTHSVTVHDHDTGKDYSGHAWSRDDAEQEANDAADEDSRGGGHISRIFGI